MKAITTTSEQVKNHLNNVDTILSEVRKEVSPDKQLYVSWMKHYWDELIIKLIRSELFYKFNKGMNEGKSVGEVLKKLKQNKDIQICTSFYTNYEYKYYYITFYILDEANSISDEYSFTLPLQDEYDINLSFIKEQPGYYKKMIKNLPEPESVIEEIKSCQGNNYKHFSLRIAQTKLR